MTTFTAEEWRSYDIEFLMVPIGIGWRHRHADLNTMELIEETHGAASLGSSLVSVADKLYYMTSDVLHTWKWDSDTSTLYVRKVTGIDQTEVTIINNPPVPCEISYPAIYTDAVYVMENFTTVINGVFYYWAVDGNIYGYDLLNGAQTFVYPVGQWRTFFPATDFMAFNVATDMMCLKLLNINEEPYIVYQMGGKNIGGDYTCKTVLQNIKSSKIEIDISVSNLITGAVSYANYGSLLTTIGLLNYDDHNYHCHLEVAGNQIAFPRWGIVNGVLYDPVKYALEILIPFRIGADGDTYDPVVYGWPNLMISDTVQGINNRFYGKNLITNEWVNGFVFRPNLDIHLGFRYSNVDNDPISFRAIPTGDIISGAVNQPLVLGQNFTSGEYKFMVYRNVVGVILRYDINYISTDYTVSDFFSTSVLLVPSDMIPQSTQPTGNYMRYA